MPAYSTDIIRLLELLSIANIGNFLEDAKKERLFIALWINCIKHADKKMGQDRRQSKL